MEGLFCSDDLKHYLEFHLPTHPEIEAVSASADSGNLLVHHAPEIGPNRIASMVQGAVIDFWRQGGIWSPPQVAEASDAPPWHLLAPEAVLAELHSDPHLGLVSSAVAERLQQYGPNRLSEPEVRSEWEILLDQFRTLPVALLGAAAGVSALTGGFTDALIILGVVGINGAIGYFTESQSEKVIRSLSQAVPQPALVLRDGRAQQVDAEAIVPGDLLLLRPGAQVAADARLLAVERLSVDESALTGESLPVTKAAAVLDSAAPLADRLNMVYMGTVVTGGQGLAVVVATADATEMGRIQALAGQAPVPETPLQRQLEAVGSQLALVAGAACGGVLLLGLLRGQSLLAMLKTSISLAVAAVPEGLPTVATTTLALGIARMRNHHLLVRRLEAVEALGSVQTLCLDKTGTITLNRMSVEALAVGGRRLAPQAGRFVAEGQAPVPAGLPELERLLQVAVLCNETQIDRQEDGQLRLRGSATEQALVVLALEAEQDVLGWRAAYPSIATTQRSEQCPYMATVHRTADPDCLLVALKGSPLEVLSLCNRELCDGRIEPLSDRARRRIEAENERMAAAALRVLGFAFVETARDDWEERRELVWLGLAGMADPIREGVKESIAKLHRAGIDTVMITGDQTPTAYAIGSALDLSRGAPLEILDSNRLDSLAPEVMQSIAPRLHVFARVSPAHKLQIVRALQSSGRIVAMTGDGINDGPALKVADVGIAMGQSGTAAAREVADVLLETDDPEMLLVAIRQGRTVQRNIRKSIHFLLATNLSELLVTFAALALGLGQPLSAVQLLWLNLITDVFPSLALALEPPEPDVLDRPPDDPSSSVLDQAQFGRLGFEAGTLSAGTLAAYGYGLARYGPGPVAGTLAFTGLAAAQLAHALSCRSERPSLLAAPPLEANPWLQLTLGGTLGLQALTLAVPGIRQLLGLAPLSVLDGVVVAGSALLPLLVNEATKTQPFGQSP